MADKDLSGALWWSVQSIAANWRKIGKPNMAAASQLPFWKLDWYIDVPSDSPSPQRSICWSHILPKLQAFHVHLVLQSKCAQINACDDLLSHVQWWCNFNYNNIGFVLEGSKNSSKVIFCVQKGGMWSMTVLYAGFSGFCADQNCSSTSPHCVLLETSFAEIDMISVILAVIWHFILSLQSCNVETREQLERRWMTVVLRVAFTTIIYIFWYISGIFMFQTTRRKWFHCFYCNPSW